MKKHIVSETPRGACLNLHRKELSVSPVQGSNKHLHPSPLNSEQKIKYSQKAQFLALLNLATPILLVEVLSLSTAFRRNQTGVWMPQIYGLGNEVEFKSLNFRYDIESIYLKVPGIQS